MQENVVNYMTVAKPLTLIEILKCIKTKWQSKKLQVKCFRAKLVFLQNQPTIAKETPKQAEWVTVNCVKRYTIIIIIKWYRTFLRIVRTLYHNISLLKSRRSQRKFILHFYSKYSVCVEWIQSENLVGIKCRKYPLYWHLLLFILDQEIGMSSRYTKYRNVINALNRFCEFFGSATAWKIFHLNGAKKTCHQFDWFAFFRTLAKQRKMSEKKRQPAKCVLRFVTKQSLWNFLFTLSKVYLVTISGINIDITMNIPSIWP